MYLDYFRFVLIIPLPRDTYRVEFTLCAYIIRHVQCNLLAPEVYTVYTVYTHVRMYFSLPRPLKKEGNIVMGIYLKADPEGETNVTRRDCSLFVVATSMLGLHTRHF